MIKFLSPSILLCLSFVIPDAVYAQQSRDVEITSEELRELVTGQGFIRHRAVDVIGSPYLFEEFQEGTVTLYNRRTTGILQLNFNSYKNRVEYLEGDQIMALEAINMREFEITGGTRVFTFRTGYEGPRLNAEDIVQIFVDGPVTFFAKHTTSFLEDTQTYGRATQRDEYIHDSTYYLKTEDDEITRIRRLRERQIMRAINSHQRELQQFAGDHNIDFSNIEDLVRFFEYYNRLLES